MRFWPAWRRSAAIGRIGCCGFVGSCQWIPDGIHWPVVGGLGGSFLLFPGVNPWPGGGRFEAFELLVFRGFSSSVTHPTAFDPDVPALPAGSTIESAELLQGPLTPGDDQLIAGPEPVARFLQPEGWA